MSFRWVRTAWHGLPEIDRPLGCSARAILAVLCGYAQDGVEGGGDIYPSERLISSATGASISCVKRNLHLLEDVKLIRIERRIIESGRKTKNYYHLLFPQNVCNGENDNHDVQATREDVINYFDRLSRSGVEVSKDEQERFIQKLIFCEWKSNSGRIVTVERLSTEFNAWRERQKRLDARYSKKGW